MIVVIILGLDEKNLDDPPALHSPVPITSEHSSRSNQTPPMLEAYTNNVRSGSTKMQSKGSKKWLGEDSSHSLNLSLQQPPKDVYQFEKEIQKPAEPTNIMLDVDDTQTFDRNKISMNLNVYNRHESSNASLLVEAALDSVSDIQMSNSEHNVDVGGSQSCTDSLVNNLYSLSHQDNLPDVTYNHSEDLNESRDINLISPSVNDHISVTDHDLNDELPNRGISLDYSTLHHSEFSPASSPNVQARSQQLIHDYNIHVSSPAHTPRSRLDYTLGHDSEIVSPGNSPPRYDFHHTPAENLSSDDSNGIVAQNLSLNNTKDKMRLDLVGYKPHYGELDNTDMSLRKYDNIRQKYDLETDRNKMYDLEVDDRNKSYTERGMNNDIRTKFDLTSTADNIESDLRTKPYETMEHADLKMKQFDVDTDFRNKYHDDENIHTNKYDQLDSKYDEDIRNKQIDIDTDLRVKNYDSLEADRTKTTYDNNLETDIRNKAYDVIDNLEMRNKTYDSIVDSDFRSDRNFEPLVLNPTELQGLDMSARSYHNFHATGTVQGINRYHHIYSELERPSVDLRLGYSPPPPPYSHTDVLRVVSLDLTPPGRHSVDLSLRSHALHSHQLPNSRLLTDHPLQTNRLISTDHNLSTNRILSEHNRLALDQTRLLANDHNLSVTSNRLLTSESRLLPETGNRLLSDHTTNRLLSNDQLSTNRLLTSDQGRMLTDESRLLTDQTRLLDQSRLIGDSRILQPTPTNTASHDLVPRTNLSPAGYTGYPVSPSPYHASSLAARTHGNSPGHTAAASYHHYSTYY